MLQASPLRIVSGSVVAPASSVVVAAAVAAAGVGRMVETVGQLELELGVRRRWRSRTSSASGKARSMGCAVSDGEVTVERAECVWEGAIGLGGIGAVG